MNRIITTVLLTFFLVAPLSLTAAELKIAVINFKKLMEQAPQSIQASQALEKEFAPREADLSGDAEAIRKLEDDLKRAELTMTASKRAELEEEIIKRRREFNQKSNNFKEDLNLSRNKAIESIQRLVYQTALDISKQQGYDLVLTEGVLYASERIDLTKQVLGALKNAK